MKPTSKRTHSARQRPDFWLFAARVLGWISANFLAENSLSGRGTAYLQFLKGLERDRGQTAMIKYAKQARLYVVSYLSGQPLTERTVGMKLSKDWLPVALGDLLRIVRRGSTAEKRWLLTILYCTRALSAGREPNFKDITDAGMYQVPMSVEVNSFWRAIGFRKNRQPKLKEHHLFHQSSKSGPNGQALWTSVLDLFALPESLIKSISIVGGKRLTEKLTLLLKYKDLVRKLLGVQPKVNRPLSIRRLSYFPDREDKVRVVAILDYFSQSSLKPLHDCLFEILKRIKQDCTFNQAAFNTKLKEPNGSYWSCDLTAATDRFPIEVIGLVLQGVFSKTFVDAWKDIMVGYAFTCEGKDYKYGVGNPMGAYSSWNSFTLAHHFVVFQACERAGIRWKEANYVILGDDIVIGDDRIAKEYLSLMKGYGVSVSKQKTHVSSHTYEFAKRWIHKGEEISPFPIAGWKEVCSKYHLATNFLLSVSNKGWVAPKGVPECVASWSGIGQTRPATFRNKMLLGSQLVETTLGVVKGTITGEQSVETIAQLFGLPLPPKGYYSPDYLWERSCIEAFTASASQDDKKGKGLGYLAEYLVLNLTNPDLGIPIEDAFELIQSIPVLNVQGRLEELYLGLKKQAFRIDTKGEAWPLLLRAMILPASDEVFSARNFDVLPMAGAVLGRRLIGQIIKINEMLGVSSPPKRKLPFPPIYFE